MCWHCFLLLFSSPAYNSVIKMSMGLEHEPALEPLHIHAYKVWASVVERHRQLVEQGGCLEMSLGRGNGSGGGVSTVGPEIHRGPS